MAANLKSWTSQLRKGAAEFTVLALLAEKPRSGIDILRALSESPDIGLAEGSIYPLLNRLENDGNIVGEWRPSTTKTRNVKIYQLTDNGRDLLLSMDEVWKGFRTQLEKIAKQARE